ncbi:PH domain-containing protein [soil metagenome]
MSARQWAFPLVFVVVGTGGSLVTAPLLVLALAGLLGWRILAWSRFSYRIDGDAVRTEQGVLNRQRREVPIRRIQQVDLQRKLRHRVLGVAVVRIDTAGGSGGAEVVLEAIGDQEAMALRQALLVAAGRAARPAGSLDVDHDDGDDDHGAADGTSVPQSPPEVIAELDTRQLVLAGVTGSRLGAALPLVAVFFGLFAELPSRLADSIADTVGDQSQALGVVIPVLLIVAVPVVLAMAAGSSILTDHGFTLVRVGTDLHLRRGLLDQREATLSLQRIQVVRIYDNPVRRRLGLVSVQLQSAGSGSASEGAVSRLTIPFVRTADLDDTLARVLPGSAPRPDLVAAPPQARRRVWFRRLTPVAAVVTAFVLATWSWWSLFTLALLVPVGLIAEQAFRGLGHVATPTFVFARRGGLFRETVVVPVAKTQSSRLRSSPFQRRVDLATLQFGVAGRGRTPAAVDADVTRLRTLRHTALYTSEARADEEAIRRRTRGEAEAVADEEPVPVDA